MRSLGFCDGEKIAAYIHFFAEDEPHKVRYTATLRIYEVSHRENLPSLHALRAFIAADVLFFPVYLACDRKRSELVWLTASACGSLAG